MVSLPVPSSPMSPSTPPTSTSNPPTSTSAELSWKDVSLSPTKREMKARTRKEITKSAVARRAVVDDDFIQHHLPLQLPDIHLGPNEAGTELDIDVEVLEEFFVEIITSTREIDLYHPVFGFLTILSTAVHAGLPEDTRPRHAIIFLDHHTAAPAHHALHPKHAPEPDGYAIAGPVSLYDAYFNESLNVYLGVPYPKLISAVEMKIEETKTQGVPQIISYTCTHLEACPDKVGVYALSVSPQGYQVIWSDPGGVVVSPLEEWTISPQSMPLLLKYILSLYHPRDDHITVDSTVKYSPGPQSRKRSSNALWDITCSDQHTYKNCNRIVVGTGWGDRTDIWTTIENGKRVLIKDSFHHQLRPVREDILLKRVHANGLVPGVGEPIHSELVMTEHNGQKVAVTTLPTFPGNNSSRLEKVRLVFNSHGTRMIHARSVKGCLMSIYDLLETHRYLSNIGKFEKDIVKEGPKFIDEVLGIKSDYLGGARCLLLDFHNAASLDPDEFSPASSSVSHIIPKTSSPTFAARAIALGCHATAGTEARQFVRMPDLEGEAKALYIKTYDQETYDKYLDNVETYHGGSPIPKPTVVFSHRPDHVVESVFWMLLVSIMRFKPLNASDEDPNLGNLRHNWAYLEEHSFVPTVLSASKDPRSHLLGRDATNWKDILHPGLHECASLIAEMANQISPEYGLLDPPPKEDHLHEALQRILLQYIVNMHEDIELDPMNLRSIDPPKQPNGVGPTSSSSKCKVEDTVEDATKRRRQKRQQKQKQKQKASEEMTTIWNQRTLDGAEG
ncbi:hypothetical protein ABKN59_008720 [Abortiporus biennis]